MEIYSAASVLLFRKKKNIKWIQGKRESDETSPPQFKTIYIAHLWTYFYLCMYTHKSPKHLN